MFCCLPITLDTSGPLLPPVVYFVRSWGLASYPWSIHCLTISYMSDFLDLVLVSVRKPLELSIIYSHFPSLEAFSWFWSLTLSMSSFRVQKFWRESPNLLSPCLAIEVFLLVFACFSTSVILTLFFCRALHYQIVALSFGLSFAPWIWLEILYTALQNKPCSVSS